MYSINQIKINGFRRLKDIDLPVRSFMTLIGANGVGKTSILDVFNILSASASGKLNATIAQFGGIVSLLTRGVSQKLSFLVTMTMPNHQPLEYQLLLEPRGANYVIAKEVLTQSRQEHDKPFKHIDSSYTDIRYFEVDSNGLMRPNWEHNTLETALYQVPKMYTLPEEFRRILASTSHYHLLAVGSRAPVKLPQQMKPAILPGPDGEDLVPYLYYLRESDPDRYEVILDTLYAAFPGFESLSFPPVSAGMLTMTVKDTHFTKPLYMHEMSEGMLRFLWLTALLYSPSLPAITMIDEPEVSLHPELLSLLADVMREAAQRTQLIVATHSDRFIRFLRPEELVVMDIGDDGCAQATWADSLDLDRWLEEYSLDEIWRMGHIGGRS